MMEVTAIVRDSTMKPLERSPVMLISKYENDNFLVLLLVRDSTMKPLGPYLPQVKHSFQEFY
jgi:hypothetical protein